MKRIYRFLFLCAVCCNPILFTACEDDTDDGGSQELSTEKWIVNFLHKEYLWNDEAQKQTPDYGSPDRLFYSLLSMKDGKTKADGKHYYYSYIEKKAATKAIDTESTYGFDFVLYNMTDAAGVYLGYYWAKIVYVLPGSPADKAGLKRNDWITRIDKVQITESNYKRLMKGATVKFTRLTESIGGNSEKEVEVPASVHIDENPLLLDTVLNVGNTKVGYLVYNHFKTGKEDNADDHTYDDEMVGIFKNFQDEEVTEFVLDLRYNGGGYLSSAQLLAGFFIAREDRTSIFCYLEDNRGEKVGYPFTDKGYHLGLSRIFILVSSQTASASEAIINGLKPYMEVILIGGTTEGKNVGSIHEEHGEWAIQPIISRIYNKDKVSGYEDGFTPDEPFICNELNTGENRNLLPLGNQREYMLAKALAVIKGKSPAAAPATRSIAPGREPVYNSVERKQCNAVIIR